MWIFVEFFIPMVIIYDQCTEHAFVVMCCPVFSGSMLKMNERFVLHAEFDSANFALSAHWLRNEYTMELHYGLYRHQS